MLRARSTHQAVEPTTSKAADRMLCVASIDVLPDLGERPDVNPLAAKVLRTNQTPTSSYFTEFGDLALELVRTLVDSAAIGKPSRP
jgi:hypothetical protein